MFTPGASWVLLFDSSSLLALGSACQQLTLLPGGACIFLLYNGGGAERSTVSRCALCRWVSPWGGWRSASPWPCCRMPDKRHLIIVAAPVACWLALFPAEIFCSPSVVSGMCFGRGSWELEKLQYIRDT